MKRGLILGFFDGVHTAHQAVIKSALDYAGEAMLITFKDSPAKYFNQKAEYIYTRKQSLKKIMSLGVSEVIELDFAEIANMPADEYLKFIVQKYNPISISTGYNHTFGKNRSGNPDFLAENADKFGYKYICVPPQMFNDQIISSTLIRKLLKEGNILLANRLLGTNFMLEGTVIRGAQLGRTIGFPTANIKYTPEIVQIPFGVYSARVNNRPAVLNWGMKPTVHNTKELWEESGRWDVYGKELMRLRDRHNREMCLGPTHEEIITAIARDGLKSYKQLPVNLYQIQSKFRDEVRPRFGLLRGREFIMKDAYSFDMSQEGLEKEYENMAKAYTRIFQRCGLNTKMVQSDSGAIGGSVSHEFMVITDTDAGENDVWLYPVEIDIGLYF